MDDSAAAFRVSAEPYERDIGRYGPDLSNGSLAAADVARVTRSGGTITACVWDYSGEMTELATLFGRAGLHDVRGDELTALASYESLDDLIAPLASGVAPAGAHYTSLDVESRGRLAVGTVP
jgi:hypothetical protein